MFRRNTPIIEQAREERSRQKFVESGNLKESLNSTICNREQRSIVSQMYPLSLYFVFIKIELFEWNFQKLT